jgi:hypothetical protein
MRKKLKDLPRLTKLMLIAPLAILGMVIFAWIGGQLVMHLWNWLAPELFGLRQITFWQALGLLALCRILFGGFRLGGDGNRNSRRRREGRMSERWEQMTPEEQERFRQGLHDRSGRTTPLDSNQSA